MQPTVSSWRKSARCSANNGCVEIARLIRASLVGVRDSKDVANSPILEFRQDEWASFTQRAKSGDFDLI